MSAVLEAVLLTAIWGAVGVGVASMFLVRGRE